IGQWENYRKVLVKGVLRGVTLTEIDWSVLNQVLVSIVGEGAVPQSLEEYFKYSECAVIESQDAGEGSNHDELMLIGNNTFRSKYGFDIEVSTIHGVKGETHDATLVLETKFH